MRFLGAIWNPADAGHVAAVLRETARIEGEPGKLVRLVDEPGFRLFVRPGEDRHAVFSPGEGAGAVIGIVFNRSGIAEDPLRYLPALTSAALRRGETSTFINGQWGNYVAVWCTPGGEVHVLRDPCGALSCYVTRVDGVLWLFSHGQDFRALSGASRQVDWSFIRSFLANNFSVTPYTGLAGVSEILPGQHAIIRPGEPDRHTWAWNGLELAADPENMSFADARERLRESVTTCIASWARAFDSHLVRLSGGLDSSIVLNVLRRVSDRPVTAIHLVGSSYEGYEVSLARAAAEHAGVALIEASLDPRSVDWRAILAGPPLLRPSKQAIGMAAEDLVKQSCERIGAACVMAGHGGDAIFLQRSLAADALTDHFTNAGLGNGFLQSAYAAASLQERSVWSVLRALGRVCDEAPERAAPSRMDKGVFEDIAPDYLSHPWFVQSSGLPPAKRLQLKSLVALRNYHAVRGYGEDRLSILPLVSQPIIDAALQTPAQLFIRGGEDRALARRAFADVLPHGVVRRTGKGFVNHRMLLIVERNLDFVRELVLDGEIARQAWLDRDLVEQMLSPEHLLRGDGLEPVLSLFVAEAWVRVWRRAP